MAAGYRKIHHIAAFVLPRQYKCCYVGNHWFSTARHYARMVKMVQEPKRSKTESLTLRLDPKTKFILEFVARINGQSITTVVERAIKNSSQSVCVNPNRENDEEAVRNWTNFWDPDESVRTLKLISDPDYPTTFEEDELLSFIKDHWQFFYVTATRHVVRSAYVQILWPNIDRYLEIWRSKRTQNWWSAGEAMKADLGKAQVASPEWPPKPREPPPKKPVTTDLDDEIPF